MQQAASRRVIIMVFKSRSGAGVHPTPLQNTTENMFQNIHRRSLLPALGPARRYPRPRNHRKRTLIRFQTCISCTPCAAAAAAAAAALEKYLSALGQSPEGFALMKTDT